MHRVLTSSLLKSMYDGGKRLPGLETLASIDDVDPDLQDRKYPMIYTGCYCKELQFGKLISKALKVGFTLFAYEAEGGQNGKER